MDSQLKSLLAVSRHFRLPVRWVKAEAEANRLPHLRIGRKLLFSLPAVEQELIQRASRLPAEQQAEQQEVAYA